jgi:hypothetical protein
MTNKDSDSSKKFSAAVERLAKLRLKVTDGTCKGKAIGFVGGVSRPKAKSVEDDDSPAGSPKPSVN